MFSSFFHLLVLFFGCCCPVFHTSSDLLLAAPATLAYQFPRASLPVLFTELAIDHWFYRNLLLQHNESSSCLCAAWQVVDGQSFPPLQRLLRAPHQKVRNGGCKAPCAPRQCMAASPLPASLLLFAGGDSAN